MKYLHLLLPVLLLVLASCSFNNTSYGKSIMNLYAIKIENKSLEIMLPDRKEDTDYLFGKEQDIPSEINISDSSIFNKHDVFVFIKKIWGWKSPFIGKSYGNLSFTALVKKAKHGSLANTSDLINFIKEKDKRQYASVIGVKENGKLIIKLPDDFETILINGAEFIHYKIRHRNEYEPYYVLQIDDTHYLSFSFSYTPNSKEQESNWRNSAREIQESILDSIIIKD